eukprot:3265591-Pleurochrysis_carterae.AAC.1
MAMGYSTRTITRKRHNYRKFLSEVFLGTSQLPKGTLTLQWPLIDSRHKYDTYPSRYVSRSDRPSLLPGAASSPACILPEQHSVVPPPLTGQEAAERAQKAVQAG